MLLPIYTCRLSSTYLPLPIYHIPLACACASAICLVPIGHVPLPCAYATCPCHVPSPCASVMFTCRRAWASGHGQVSTGSGQGGSGQGRQWAGEAVGRGKWAGASGRGQVGAGKWACPCGLGQPAGRAHSRSAMAHFASAHLPCALAMRHRHVPCNSSYVSAHWVVPFCPCPFGVRHLAKAISPCAFTRRICHVPCDN